MELDLQRAEKSLRMKGVAHHENVSVKIVSHGDGFGVETTVSGDRRYPVEEPMPREEAIRLAISQLVEPRASYTYVPTPRDDKPSPPPSQLPYASVGDLVIRYRSRGMGKQEALTSTSKTRYSNA